MKKIICGALITIIGLVFTALCLVYTANNPYCYNGNEGFFASLLGNKTLIPVLLSSAVMIFGVAYSFVIAYKKDE